MQTFLPSPIFSESAKALDSKRLNKQKLECTQILTVLKHKREGTLPYGKLKLGWANHPAVLMWVGYEDALKAYLLEIILECERRGIKNTTPKPEIPKSVDFPRWLGNSAFHKSHQSNLVRKDKAFYGPKFTEVSDDMSYYWPSRLSKYRIKGASDEERSTR